MNHLDSNGILTDRQFGFRKRGSCETQLLITVQDLAQGLRDKQQIDAVILDFSKAFDKVSHRHLLLKLEHYGVRGHTLSWIGDFLIKRMQSHDRGDSIWGVSCQLDAFQMDAVNFQRANKTRSSWTRPNETRPR